MGRVGIDIGTRISGLGRNRRRSIAIVGLRRYRCYYDRHRHVAIDGDEILVQLQRPNIKFAVL